MLRLVSALSESLTRQTNPNVLVGNFAATIFVNEVETDP
jgi:hypothetical protein